MDLALNNFNGWYAIKPKQTNHNKITNKRLIYKSYT